MEELITELEWVSQRMRFMAAWALLIPMLELGGGEDKMKVLGGLLTAGETEHETCRLSAEDDGCEDDEELRRR